MQKGDATSAGATAQEVIDSIQGLAGWLDRNGWAGYDPYDIRGHPWVLKLASNQSHNIVTRLGKGAALKGIANFPLASRRLLRIQKQINAKAMGLFASAYLNLYQQLGTEAYLKKAYDCLGWLEQNMSRGYSGAGWGYPFHWQNLILIPKGTPSAVVSSICGNAFWDFYRFTGDKKYLAVCESICRFFLNDLNIDHVTANTLCFSYTPRDKFHVHNANLFAAEFLLRVGSELKREFVEYGLKAANYTLEAQNQDGSFYYWALSEEKVYNMPPTVLRRIDHYHTGFVLRSLYSIYKTTGEPKVLQALSRGYQFYKDNLFEGMATPKMTPHSIYPINIHSCAEAILCMSTLSDVFPDALEYARNAFLWTRENMQDKEGFFYFRKTSRRVDKTPYLRWGQAWMLIALSELLGKLSQK